MGLVLSKDEEQQGDPQGQVLNLSGGGGASAGTTADANTNSTQSASGQPTANGGGDTSFNDVGRMQSLNDSSYGNHFLQPIQKEGTDAWGALNSAISSFNTASSAADPGTWNPNDTNIMDTGIYGSGGVPKSNISADYKAPADTHGATNDQVNQIINNYNSVFHRDPDAGGLAAWEGAAAGGMTNDQIQKAFYSSPEYATQQANSNSTPATPDQINAATGLMNTKYTGPMGLDKTTYTPRVTKYTTDATASKDPSWLSTRIQSENPLETQGQLAFDSWLYGNNDNYKSTLSGIQADAAKLPGAVTSAEGNATTTANGYVTNATNIANQAKGMVTGAQGADKTSLDNIIAAINKINIDQNNAYNTGNWTNESPYVGSLAPKDATGDLSKYVTYTPAPVANWETAGPTNLINEWNNILKLTGSKDPQITHTPSDIFGHWGFDTNGYNTANPPAVPAVTTPVTTPTSTTSSPSTNTATTAATGGLGALSVIGALKSPITDLIDASGILGTSAPFADTGITTVPGFNGGGPMSVPTGTSTTIGSGGGLMSVPGTGPDVASVVPEEPSMLDSLGQWYTDTFPGAGWGSLASLIANLAGMPGNQDPYVNMGLTTAGSLGGSALGGAALGAELGNAAGPVGAMAGAVIAQLVGSLFGPGPPHFGGDAAVKDWNSTTNAPDWAIGANHIKSDNIQP